MAAVAEDRQIWLDCTALQNPEGGAVRRLLASIGTLGHTRKLIVEPV